MVNIHQRQRREKKERQGQKSLPPSQAIDGHIGDEEQNGKQNKAKGKKWEGGYQIISEIM